MRIRAVLLAVAVGVPTATRADEPPPAAPPQPQVTITPPPPAPSGVEDKTAVLTGEWVAGGRGTAPVFGMDVLIGQQMGVRPSLAVYSTARSSVMVEGFYGALLTKFGASEGAGAGVRWVTTRGGHDAVTLGPGVDVLFNLNRGRAVILAPTVDVAWRRTFLGDRAGWVLGMNAGVGVGLSGSRNNDGDEPVAGRVTPLISLYTGLRY